MIVGKLETLGVP